MLIALTGTPGTGKSAAADEIARRGHMVIRAADTIQPYILEFDEERNAGVVDTDRWSAEFPGTDAVVEGHLTHLLHADRVIILRCHPGIIRKRLAERGYHEEKVEENAEAELLDVILVEALELHTPEQIYECDVTDKTVAEVADLIESIMTGEVSPGHGLVDWLTVCADEI
jgi:adenylate kinase